MREFCKIFGILRWYTTSVGLEKRHVFHLLGLRLRSSFQSRLFSQTVGPLLYSMFANLLEIVRRCSYCTLPRWVQGLNCLRTCQWHENGLSSNSCSLQLAKRLWYIAAHHVIALVLSWLQGQNPSLYYSKVFFLFPLDASQRLVMEKVIISTGKKTAKVRALWNTVSGPYFRRTFNSDKHPLYERVLHWKRRFDNYTSYAICQIQLSLQVNHIHTPLQQTHLINFWMNLEDLSW